MLFTSADRLLTEGSRRQSGTQVAEIPAVQGGDILGLCRCSVVAEITECSL